MAGCHQYFLTTETFRNVLWKFHLHTLRYSCNSSHNGSITIQLICSFDNLYIHILLEIFISMLLKFTSCCDRSSNWDNSRTSKCCSSSGISSSVHILPFGQMIFPFKYPVRVPT